VPDLTEAQEIAALAVSGALPEPLKEGEVASVLIPEGYSHKMVDAEYLLDQPDRKRGKVSLHTTQSLIDYVNRHKVDETTTVYADKAAHKFVAVINDHRGGEPEWADHRASLTLIQTPEWLFWTRQDGQLMSQGDFATLIEDGQSEVREPDAATLLELALTFQAHTNVKFRSAQVLQSGQRQLTYEEHTEAAAGREGNLTIPAEFVLGLAPFEGAALYELRARLRYRIGEGKLAIGYHLVRPHEILDTADSDEAVRIAGGTEVQLFEGTPPEGVGR
jgi:uncharacterized protein YfdQ (DUF2303 family)